jgi:RNA polymerase sigma factor (sigma-70 family)
MKHYARHDQMGSSWRSAPSPSLPGQNTGRIPTTCSRIGVSGPSDVPSNTNGMTRSRRKQDTSSTLPTVRDIRPMGACSDPERLAVIRTDGLESLRSALVQRLVRRGTRPHDAEDIVHEAVVRLCVAQRKEHVRNPAAFLTDVVRKVSIERWRSAQRSQRLFVDEPIEEIDVIDPSPQPEECLQAEQRLERLSRGLGTLSLRARDILFLHRLQGLTCQEISVRLGISVSAIEKHIARSMAAIAGEQHVR